MITYPELRTYAAWDKPPEEIVLGTHEVHLWKCSALTNQKYRDVFHDILTEKEKHLAESFRSARAQEQYIIAHGMQRMVLSIYTGIEPGKLEFTFNKYGKPFLHTLSGDAPHFFNVSHSSDLVVMGIASEMEIGIDIEYLHKKTNVLGIAERYFTLNESEKLKSLTDDLRKRAFSQCWTRKEALLKGIGQGLSFGLSRFEVSVLPDEPAALLNADEIPEGLHWHLFDISPEADYVGTVSVKGRPELIRCYDFSPLLSLQAVPCPQ